MKKEKKKRKENPRLEIKNKFATQFKFKHSYSYSSIHTPNWKFKLAQLGIIAFLCEIPDLCRH